MTHSRRVWSLQNCGDRLISRSLALFALILGLAAGPAPGSGPATSTKPDLAGKVDPELLTLYGAYREAQRGGASFRVDSPLLRIVDDRVLIDTTAAGDVGALEADLVALGMRHAVVFDRLVSGELPIASIPALAALGSLAFARPAAASMSPAPKAWPRGP